MSICWRTLQIMTLDFILATRLIVIGQQRGTFGRARLAGHLQTSKNQLEIIYEEEWE
jgi:hypothetical protein